VSTPYNRFTGQSLERLTTLSDGIFAVAMTLLVLDLRVPVSAAASAHSAHLLSHELLKLGPGFAAYLLSFTMLGTFWLAQHALLGNLARSDRNLTWINIGFLFVVTVLPFSAGILAEFVHARLAVGLYWLNIALLGAGLAASAGYARRARLVGEGSAPHQVSIFLGRILLAQVLYGAAALICLASTIASVIAFAVVPAYFILSPRIPLLDRAAGNRTPG
jgi:uncharacterized membrane protein